MKRRFGTAVTLCLLALGISIGVHAAVSTLILGRGAFVSGHQSTGDGYLLQSLTGNGVADQAFGGGYAMQSGELPTSATAPSISVPELDQLIFLPMISADQQKEQAIHSSANVEPEMPQGAVDVSDLPNQETTDVYLPYVAGQ